VSAAAATNLILAFDFGERRIGVATGNRLTGTASPLGIVRCRDGIPLWSEIDRLVNDWAPQAFVVGRPPKGNEQLQEKIANFVHELEIRYKLRAWLVDESLSSRSAAAELSAQRSSGLRKRRVQRGDVDKLAACHIAQTWLANTDPDA
jgi:putative Holliday junction resolvase